MKIETLYEIYQEHPVVCTDTRNIQPGSIFFALKGERFNGNTFALQALTEGAAYAVIDEAAFYIDERTILVPNVLETLQSLAACHRAQFNIPFLAITGSNGKTTTKELVSAVLSAAFITYTTRGNLNNHIGIPLTILSIKPDAQMAVIEMGANHLHEIEGYCTYAQPTHGLITNCGKAHLEGFGSIEGVRKAKGELYDYLRAHNGAAFVMWDYDYLRDMSRGIGTVITYGTTKEAALQGDINNHNTFLSVSIYDNQVLNNVVTSLVGDYNLPNVLAAIAIGRYFGVADEKIKTAIESYVPSNSRSQMIEKNGNQIILDAYNANPGSMKVAIENFARLQTNNGKVLLLGAMAELGKESIAEHESIVNLLQQYKWQEVVLVGGDFQEVQHPYRQFANVEEAANWYREKNFTNTSQLIKGSRSTHMEKILE